ncbi:MAG: hypothetical protein JSS75_08295 [Bacteroidetes bacterium]|nr:hypothetical protein [Bacteroidota bacterium]
MKSNLLTHLRILFAVSVLLMSGSSAFAQGSPYSFLGFGDPVGSTHAHLLGLSQTGVALTDGSLINELNPAGFAYIPATMVDLRLRYAYDKATIGSDQGVSSMVKLGGLSAGTSVWSAASMGAAIGFTPITDAEAQTERLDSLGNTIYKRAGGLSQFYMGLAARPFGALSLGARLDIIFGNVRTQTQANISGNDVQAGIFQREYAESGLRGTFGFMLALDSLFPQLRGLTIGVSYSTASTLTATQRTIVTPISTTLDSTIEVGGYGYYPSSIRLGLAGRFGDRYRVEANLSGQDFSNARVFSLTKDLIGDPTLGSSNRYSFAFERMALGAQDARGAAFWEKVGLRLGASYAQLPFKPAAGVTVNEVGGSFGLGIPFGGGSSIDLAAELGIRTPSNANIEPKDTYFKFSATMMLGEKWFVSLRRDDDQ